MGSLDDAGSPHDGLNLGLGPGPAGGQGGAKGLQRLLHRIGLLSEEAEEEAWSQAAAEVEPSEEEAAAEEAAAEKAEEEAAAEEEEAALACKPARQVAARRSSHDTAHLSGLSSQPLGAKGPDGQGHRSFGLGAVPPVSILLFKHLGNWCSRAGHDLTPCSPHLSGGGPLPLPLAQAPAQAPAQVLGPRAVGGRRLGGTAGRGGPAIALAAAAAAAVALAVPMGPTAAAPYLLALAALLACAAGVLAAAAGRNGGRQAPTRPRDASSADPRRARAAAHAPPLSMVWEGSGEKAGCSA